jgi:hypothetical protein
MGTPRNCAISLVSSTWALPEKIFSSPKPVAINGSPITESPCENGWGGRIRTFEYGVQSPAPYRLATPHHLCVSRSLCPVGHAPRQNKPMWVSRSRRNAVRLSKGLTAFRRGLNHVVQTKSVYDAVPLGQEGWKQGLQMENCKASRETVGQTTAGAACQWLSE